MLIGDAAPVTFELRAGGVALIPSSSVTPVAPGDWEVISRTYNAADIVAYVGQPMTIVVGGTYRITGPLRQYIAFLLLNSRVNLC